MDIDNSTGGPTRVTRACTRVYGGGMGAPVPPVHPCRPTSRQVAIVPFGKFRGWPIAALFDEPEHLAWLLEQPWFRFAVSVARQPRFESRGD
jgi:hypothetical protein